MGLKGNSFYLLRSKHGRDKLFETPEQLRQALYEYIESVENNSWETNQTTVGDNGINSTTKTLQRPFSRKGFYLFIGASETWLTKFKQNCSDDFFTVIEEIEMTIDTQQFDGASIGVFKENIIARIQGIKDNSESKIFIEQPLFPDVSKNHRNQ
jgi:hypothetical protein